MMRILSYLICGLYRHWRLCAPSSVALGAPAQSVLVVTRGGAGARSRGGAVVRGHALDRHVKVVHVAARLCHHPVPLGAASSAWRVHECARPHRKKALGTWRVRGLARAAHPECASAFKSTVMSAGRSHSRLRQPLTAYLVSPSELHTVASACPMKPYEHSTSTLKYAACGCFGLGLTA